MKRLLFLLPLLLIFGCGGPSFDKEGFELSKNYVIEILPEVEKAYNDIGKRTPDEVDDSLLEHVKNIRTVNEKYWPDSKLGGKYEDKEIRTWKIKMDNGKDKWIIEGDELMDTIGNIYAYSEWFADDIEKMLEEPSEENAYNLAESLHNIENVIIEIKKVFLNEEPFFEFKPRQ